MCVCVCVCVRRERERKRKGKGESPCKELLRLMVRETKTADLLQ